MSSDGSGSFPVAILTMLSVCLAMPVAVQATNTTYYVDSITGIDTNNGTSAGTAWQTLTNVNSTTFQPGDHVLFKSGGTWSGQLHPLGSGTSGNPIVVDKYGTGSNPLFIGTSESTQTLYLYNQQYMEINNLEISANYANQLARRGIYVQAQDFGTVNHVYLQNLFVHDIKHNMNYVGLNDYRNTGGILFDITGSTTPTRFNDALINGCTVSNVDREGMFLVTGAGQYYSTNVLVSSNYLTSIGGDGIVIINASHSLIEYNVVNGAQVRNQGKIYSAGIWPWSCDDATFQFNEVYNMQTTMDGEAFDCDGYCHRTLYQYNYSHDNPGGFMLICSVNGADTSGSVIRYNISQNDGYGVRFANPEINPMFYNNVIYKSSGPIFEGSTVGLFADNIFYNAGSVSASWGAATFSNNCYYGFTPPVDAHGITSDPMLVNPGSGGSGIDMHDSDRLSGYLLKAGSPCINAGVAIAGNGGMDFWGSTVPSGGAADIGACEYTNHAPVAESQIVVVCRDAPMPISLTATDADGDSLTYQIPVLPTNGTLSGTAPDLTYKPGSGYTGSDSFQFVAADFALTSSPALVSITVAAPPPAVKMKITFAGYDRSETLTNFPALIVLSNNVAGSGFAYGQFASPNGWDLRFKDAGEMTNLNCEIECWNTNGLSYVWVQVPQLWSNSYIWASWGGTGVNQQACITNGATWSQDFRGVWHLGESSGGVVGDSTKRGHAGARNNGATLGAIGVVDGAVSFSGGVNERISAASSTDFDSTVFTVSCWIKTDLSWSHPPYGIAGLLCRGDAAGSYNGFSIYQGNGDGTVSVQMKNAASQMGLSGSQNFGDNNWHNITFVLNRNNGGMNRMYSDGFEVANAASSFAWSFNNQPLYMANSADTFWGAWKGTMDEVRFCDGELSSNWIWACWLNLASNTAFCGMGTVSGASVNEDANANGMPDAWEVANFGSTNAANGGPEDDWDGDGMKNLAEYIAGTCPTNASSRLQCSAFSVQEGTFWLSFLTVTGRVYGVMYKTSLLEALWMELTNGLPGGGVLDLSDPAADPQRFYRIKARLP